MDMLIKLYTVPDAPPGLQSGFAVRKPIGPEHIRIVNWISQQFGPGWASEAQAALANRPVSLFIALQSDALAGFACYDATARGFVGPIGVTSSARGVGVGAALLQACLRDMQAAGYGYAVAGAVGAPDFFRRAAGAVDIADSTPGLYRGMLKP